MYVHNVLYIYIYKIQEFFIGTMHETTPFAAIAFKTSEQQSQAASA